MWGTTYSNVQRTTPWTEWADAGTTVTVSEPQDIVNGYKFDHYDPSQSVTMTAAKTITLIYKGISPLVVSISPMSASIVVGQSVAFTSTVSGGYPPYSYQWYLNDVAVSGATSSGWTFTPTSSGIYYVYLKVVDANNNVVQSDVARVSVASVPVGGYSASLVKPVSYTHLTLPTNREV